MKRCMSFASILRSTSSSFRNSGPCCLQPPRTVSPRTLTPSCGSQSRAFSASPVENPAYYVQSFDKGLNVTENILRTTRTLSSQQNVRFFIDIMNLVLTSGEPDTEHTKLKTILSDISTVSEGLSRIIDMREACVRMIRSLPERSILTFDKILLHVLKDVITPDNTVVTKVNKDSTQDLIDTVRVSDRVHPIRDDVSLQHRLSEHRTVFILTHHLLPARPLVILHTAHSTGMFQCVTDILQGGTQPHTPDSLCRVADTPDTPLAPSHTDTPVAPSHTDTPHDLRTDTGGLLTCTQLSETQPYHSVHTFYSISSLEIGLRGIPVGGWLVTKAKVMLADPANRTIFSTLSPIPGFTHWIRVSLNRNKGSVYRIIGDKQEDLTALMTTSTQVPDSLRDTITRLAVYYLLREKQRGFPLDTVAQFHVGNGAAVWALRWGGTRSVEMTEQSLGLMVNYLYDQNSAARAAAYRTQQTISVGAAVQALLQ